MMDKLDVATFSRNSFTYNAIVRAMIAVIISTFRPPQKLQLVATNQNIFANKENCAEFTVDVDIICCNVCRSTSSGRRPTSPATTRSSSKTGRVRNGPVR